MNLSLGKIFAFASGSITRRLYLHTAIVAIFLLIVIFITIWAGNTLTMITAIARFERTHTVSRVEAMVAFYEYHNHKKPEELETFQAKMAITQSYNKVFSRLLDMRKEMTDAEFVRILESTFSEADHKTAVIIVNRIKVLYWHPILKDLVADAVGANAAGEELKSQLAQILATNNKVEQAAIFADFYKTRKKIIFYETSFSKNCSDLSNQISTYVNYISIVLLIISVGFTGLLTYMIAKTVIRQAEKYTSDLETEIQIRKQAEETLRNSEEKYRALVSNLSSGVVVHAPDSTVIFSNPKAATLLGLTKEQILGKTAIDPAWCFLRENGTPMPLAEYPVNRVLSSGEPIVDQFLEIHRTDQAEPAWVQCNSYPVFDADGSILQVVVTFSDITKLKKYEHELQDKNAELERFTYTVSHDLKSPIITIKGFIGSMEKDLSKGNYERLPSDLKRVSAAADKMNDLLRDLLELSTIGRVINAPIPVDMNLLIDEVLAQLAWPLKNHNLTVDVQPGLPPLLCDRRRMAEVLQNLVENAINYMGAQAEPQIMLGVREEGGEEDLLRGGQRYRH